VVSRPLSFFIFFAVALLITGALHYYIWARLVRDLGLPPGAHRALTALVVVLFASVPGAFWLQRSLPFENTRPLMLLVFGWMGLAFLTIVVLFGVDLVRLAYAALSHLRSDAPPVDPVRRLSMSRMVGAGVAMSVAGLGAVATYSGLKRLLVREVRVPLARLPPSLSGFTIAQLTDIHVGPTIRREFIENIVTRTNALKPDLIAITGDLVDGSVEQLREHVAPLAKLSAKHGVFFVTGNHEYYSGPEAWCAELERLGIRVLRNERVSIGEGGDSFDLAGVDDYSAARFGRGHGPNLEQAIAGRDPARALVLLAHQPRAIFEAAARGVSLQLSGHTHGGQLFPWNFLVRLQQPVVSGLERIGDAFIYVSNGTGYWGPPMRLGAPAEITRVILEST
jgi:hypothetical protein